MFRAENQIVPLLIRQGIFLLFEFPVRPLSGLARNNPDTGIRLRFVHILPGNRSSERILIGMSHNIHRVQFQQISAERGPVSLLALSVLFHIILQPVPGGHSEAGVFQAFQYSDVMPVIDLTGTGPSLDGKCGASSVKSNSARLQRKRAVVLQQHDPLPGRFQ